MNNAKTKAAEALFPVLAHFQAIEGRPLSSVSQMSTDGCLDKLCFDFGDLSLFVLADREDDSINLDISTSAAPHARDVSGTDLWRSFINQPFGWGWLTVNQQGYCDGVLLSFDGIVPQILLNVVASSIKVMHITN
jgi:hypothetical protein